MARGNGSRAADLARERQQSEPRPIVARRGAELQFVKILSRISSTPCRLDELQRQVAAQQGEGAASGLSRRYAFFGQRGACPFGRRRCRQGGRSWRWWCRERALRRVDTEAQYQLHHSGAWLVAVLGLLQSL